MLMSLILWDLGLFLFKIESLGFILIKWILGMCFFKYLVVLVKVLLFFILVIKFVRFVFNFWIILWVRVW